VVQLDKELSNSQCSDREFLWAGNLTLIGTWGHFHFKWLRSVWVSRSLKKIPSYFNNFCLNGKFLGICAREIRDCMSSRETVLMGGFYLWTPFPPPHTTATIMTKAKETNWLFPSTEELTECEDQNQGFQSLGSEWSLSCFSSIPISVVSVCRGGKREEIGERSHESMTTATTMEAETAKFKFKTKWRRIGPGWVILRPL